MKEKLFVYMINLLYLNFFYKKTLYHKFFKSSLYHDKISLKSQNYQCYICLKRFNILMDKILPSEGSDIGSIPILDTKMLIRRSEITSSFLFLFLLKLLNTVLHIS